MATLSSSTNEETSTPVDNYGIVTTSNQLHDIIEWLQLGHYVVLKSKNANRVFLGDKNAQNDYDKASIIVECVTCPGLLDDGEWNWYINRGGFPEYKVNNENEKEINTKLNSRPVVEFRS